MNENVFEFFKDSNRVTVTLSQGRMINRFVKMAKEHSDEMDYVINKDGSLFGHMPVSYLHVYPPRKLSDEEIDRRRENGRKMYARFGLQTQSKSNESR